MGTRDFNRAGGGAAGRSDAGGDQGRPRRGRGKSQGRGGGQVDVTRQAAIVAAFGAPGSGKSHLLKQLLEQLRPERLILVDPDAEYGAWGELTDSPVRVLQHLGLPHYRIRFRPAYDRSTAERQFAWLCATARWQVDPQPGQAKPASTAPIVFAVDELADYVGAAETQAPAGWQWLVRRGRKYGVTVFAASQRPEDINKGLFSFASLVRTGRLNDPRGQARLAGALGVPVARVAALSGTQYLARDRLTGQLLEGGEAASGAAFSAGRSTE